MRRDQGQLTLCDTSPRHTGDPLMAPRERTEPGDQLAVRHATPGRSGVAREGALLRLREDLLDYLAEAGVGAQFQAVDFTHWLDVRGRVPDQSVLDLRAVGGLVVQLRNHGLIEEIDFRSNGGDKQRGHNACRRPVYVIRSLDAARLGWVERSAA